MVDALKSMDKKYLMIIGGIFGILLLVIIVLASMKGCSGPSKNYQSAENKMVKAAKEYFKETYNRDTVVIPNGVNSVDLIPANIIKNK